MPKKGERWQAGTVAVLICVGLFGGLLLFFSRFRKKLKIRTPVDTVTERDGAESSGRPVSEEPSLTQDESILNGTEENAVNERAQEVNPLVADETKQKKKGCGCSAVVFFLLLVLIAGFKIIWPMFCNCRSEDSRMIAEMRTRIEIYRLKNGHLPGLLTDKEGRLVKNSPDGTYCVNTCGQTGSNYIQTMGLAVSDYRRLSVPAFMDAAGVVEFCDASNEVNTCGHAFKQLGLSLEDVTGGGYRLFSGRQGVGIPDHVYHYYVQYVVPYSDGGDGNYCFAVGIFGDDHGLHQGSGRAVLEFEHARSKKRFVATYERYGPARPGYRLFSGGSCFSESAAPHVEDKCRFLLPQSGFKNVPGSGGVIIPSLDGITHASGWVEEEMEIAKFKDALVRAGWEL